MDAGINYGAKLFGVSTSRSEYISLFEADIFLGPLFYLYNNNVFRVPFAFGFHMYYFNDNLWVPYLDGDTGMWISRNDTQFGLGFSLGFQLHFTSGVYLFSRAGVSLDFIRIHTISGYDGTDAEGDYCLDFEPVSWNIKPSVGIGIRF